MSCEGEKCKKILVLYTGGTIGMMKNRSGVYTPPKSDAFLKKIKSFPELHEEATARKYRDGNDGVEYLALTHVHNNCRILYAIKEYDPLLDSSNMSVKDWIRMAKDIEEYYDQFDGFVILHGTDTLAYTASSLSFMLEGLAKTVVLTGSQIPIFEPRSDAKDNFLSSLIFAACYDIPEVCVCFANKLLRGNRTIKSDSVKLKAFTSPNYRPLGEVGINFKVHPQYILKANPVRPLSVHTDLNENVGSLHLFPTVSHRMMKAFLKPPIEGIVLQSYGIGNIPSNRIELTELLRQAVARGIIIVNITQCTHGMVKSLYETGKALEDLGIIPGYDLTREAALSKLSYILGLPGLSVQERKDMMRTNIRGELTPH